jgi:phenylacetate-CoA ligase
MRLARLRDLAKWALLGERNVHLADFDPSVEELRTQLQRLPSGRRYFIWGYPSYIARVAAQLLESGSALPAYPRVVISYGETLSLLNAATIAEAFRCRVVNHYSSWEVLHLAQTCPDQPTALHVNSERAILRVIQTNGEPAPPGVVGRVVVTDLANYVMPFINYDLGDWAEAGARCPCGRGFPTLQGLEGRLGEVIRTPTGRGISPLTICRFLRIVARADPYIWEYQAVQTTHERVVVSIVPTPRFSAQFAAKLEAALAGFLGPGMQVDIQAVDRIAVEASGKRLLVKSYLNPS